ncbi:MAG TPA: hypothetical protein VFO69_13695 [Allosphingosinicella sp.]|nr:hypothetical protein [Allosphingosinicella sp.]
MGNGGTAALPLQRGDRPENAIGGNELARGLMLVRASAIRMARLQVAIERRDRRLVLKTMDDLVSLDGEMRDLVERIPRSDFEIDALQHELDEQKAALAREKLALVGGVSRRELQNDPATPAVDPAEPPTPSTLEGIEAATPDPIVRENLGAEPALPLAWSLADEVKGSRDWIASFWAIMIVLLLFAAVAGAILLFGTEDPAATMRGFIRLLGG